MGDLAQWFNSLPPMTRTWFGGTIAFSLLGRFGLLNPHWLILHYEPLVHSFQVSGLVRGLVGCSKVSGGGVWVSVSCGGDNSVGMNKYE